MMIPRKFLVFCSSMGFPYNSRGARDLGHPLVRQMCMLVLLAGENVKPVFVDQASRRLSAVLICLLAVFIDPDAYMVRSST